MYCAYCRQRWSLTISLGCCVCSTSLLSSICCSLSANRLHLSSSSLRASWVSARRFTSSMILRIFLRPLGVPALLFISSASFSLSLCSNTERSNKSHDHYHHWSQHYCPRLGDEDRDNKQFSSNSCNISCYLFAVGVRQPNAGHLFLLFSRWSGAKKRS